MNQGSMDMDVMQEFFTEIYSPTSFLEDVHRLMMNYMSLAWDPEYCRKEETARDDIEFLSLMYDTVKRARDEARKKERCTRSEETPDTLK